MQIDDKKILSIDADDDDLDIKSFTNYLEDHTLRDKNKVAKDFAMIGNDLLAEIEEKKQIKEKEKKIYSRYILKHSKKKFTEKQLLSYTLEDVIKIHDDLKKERLEKNTVRNFFHFLFNL
jgi:hypothetical protein